MIGDLDIDTRSDFDPMRVFNNVVKASVIKNDELTPHPCGVYFQDIAVDPITKLAAIPYDVADGIYLKFDFLHIHIYNYFESRDEIEQLVNEEPDWNLLLINSCVEKLFQISKHFEVVSKIKPKSVIELADVIALIRPGKKELLNLYLKNKDLARKMLYSKDENQEYSFKKSHAIAYSMVIILQLHLISAGILK